jgi:SPP1 family predicted phage head-tail adaptor
MRAGDLRDRITLQRVTRIADEMGGQQEDWSDLATVWACVRPVGGRDRLDAMRLGAAGEYRITIRWRADAAGQPYYTTADRLIWCGRQYAVRNVQPLGPRGTWLEILVAEGVPS